MARRSASGVRASSATTAVGSTSVASIPGIPGVASVPSVASITGIPGPAQRAELLWGTAGEAGVTVGELLQSLDKELDQRQQPGWLTKSAPLNRTTAEESGAGWIAASEHVPRGYAETAPVGGDSSSTTISTTDLRHTLSPFLPFLDLSAPAGLDLLTEHRAFRDAICLGRVKLSRSHLERTSDVGRVPELVELDAVDDGPQVTESRADLVDAVEPVPVEVVSTEELLDRGRCIGTRLDSSQHPFHKVAQARDGGRGFRTRDAAVAVQVEHCVEARDHGILPELVDLSLIGIAGSILVQSGQGLAGLEIGSLAGATGRAAQLPESRAIDGQRVVASQVLKATHLIDSPC